MFISQNQLSQIKLNIDSNLLEWSWHLDHGLPEKKAFEQSLIRYDHMANSHYFDKVLLDVQTFEKVIDLDTQNWIRHNFSKSIDFRKVQYLALVSSKNLLAQRSIEKLVIHQIPNKINLELFTNDQKARTWLQSLR